MATVTKRELNQQTAHVLAAVEDGEPVVVTERGVARWRIERISHDEMTRRRSDGRVTTPRPEPTPWPAGPARYTPAEIDDLLDAERAER